VRRRRSLEANADMAMAQVGAIHASIAGFIHEAGSSITGKITAKTVLALASY